MERMIRITEPDMKKLSSLLEAWRPAREIDRDHARSLEEELERAKIVDHGEAPADVVTMNSRVSVTDLDSGREHTYTIVFPRDADLAAGRISVLAPIGTALLGYAVGDEIKWNVPGGVRRLRIDAVLHNAFSTANLHAA
jgi:regulator of nucleoside diphosphate kinase